MASRSGLRACVLAAAAAVVACGGPGGEPDATGKPGGDEGESAEAGIAADLGGRRVMVAVENAYLPFSYINAASGEAEGWDYDILAELCDRLNCEPVFVAMPWAPTLEAVGHGDIDMAANGIVINDERDRIVDFADSYGSARQYLFARVGEDRFSSADELSEGDYVIAAQVNTVNSALAGKLVGEANVTAFDYLGDAVAAVAVGEADAFLHLLRDGQELMGPYASEVRIVGEPLAQLDYGFIFSEGSDLVAPFNEALAAMRADGVLAELNDRYFGPSFSISPEDISPPAYEEPLMPRRSPEPEGSPARGESSEPE